MRVLAHTIMSRGSDQRATPGLRHHQNGGSNLRVVCPDKQEGRPHAGRWDTEPLYGLLLWCRPCLGALHGMQLYSFTLHTICSPSCWVSTIFCMPHAWHPFHDGYRQPLLSGWAAMLLLPNCIQGCQHKPAHSLHHGCCMRCKPHQVLYGLEVRCKM